MNSFSLYGNISHAVAKETMQGYGFHWRTKKALGGAAPDCVGKFDHAAAFGRDPVGRSGPTGPITRMPNSLWFSVALLLATVQGFAHVTLFNRNRHIQRVDHMAPKTSSVVPEILTVHNAPIPDSSASRPHVAAVPNTLAVDLNSQFSMTPYIASADVPVRMCGHF